MAWTLSAFADEAGGKTDCNGDAWFADAAFNLPSGGSGACDLGPGRLFDNAVRQIVSCASDDTSLQIWSRCFPALRAGRDGA